MRCDACHNGSYTGEGTKGAQGTASFAGHVPTNGYDCISCHAQAATTFTRISPSPGEGTGWFDATRTSGPPGSRMAMLAIDFGKWPFDMNPPY